MMLSPSELVSMNLKSAFSSDQAVRRVLEKLPDLRFENAHSGIIQLGKFTAQFKLELENQLHIRCPAINAVAAEDALARSAEFPGNLRYARTNAGTELLADVPFSITPEGTIAIEQVIQALGTISGDGELPGLELNPPTAEAIDRALAKSDLSEDDLVRMDSSWELRPRLRGEVTAVQLTRTDHGVRLRRSMLSNYEASSNRGAVALQSLLLNANLRGVRLAEEGNHLVAECHLPVGLLTGESIVEAARAVGVAYRHSQLVLEIVAGETDVATQLLNLCS